MAASSYYTEVQELYLAYFGRPADTFGLAHYSNYLNSGGTVSGIMSSFGRSAESQALYGTDVTAGVVRIYQALFNRDPDAEGLTFYVNAVNSGTFTLPTVALNILKGAKNADATIIANKITAASSFTAALDTAAELIGYSGDAAAQIARDWLATVTADTATVTTASASLDGTLATITENGGASTAAVSLTTSVETVTGTSSNDTFNANTIDGASTLNPGDIINAGNGTDTLNIVAYGSGATGVTLNSVEKVNVRLMSAQTFDTALWSGTTSINVTSDSSGSVALTLNNLASTVTVGVAHKDETVNLSYADLSGAADTSKLKLDSASSTTIHSNAGLEATTITNSGTSTLTLSSAGTNLTVNGAGNFTVSDTVASYSSINYAGFSGTTNTTISVAGTLTFTGGAGNDTINVGATLTSADTLAGGAGTDKLVATVENLADNTKGVTGFETAALRLTSATNTLSLNSASFSTLEITGYSAATTTVTLTEVSGTDVIRLAGAGASAGLTYHVGFVTGQAGLVEIAAAGVSADGGFHVSGADSFTLSNVASGSTTLNSVSGLTVVDATTVTLAVGGSASLSNAAASFQDATTLNIRASGDATITTSTITASSLTAVNINADTGTSAAKTTVGALSLNTGAHTIAVTASGKGEVSLGHITTKASSQDVITITVGDNAEVGSASQGNIIGGGSGSLSFSVTTGTSGTAKFGTISGNGNTINTLSLVAGASAVIAGSTIGGKSISGVTISSLAEGSATIGAISAATNIGNVTLSQTSSGTTTVGDITAVSAVGNLALTGGVDSEIAVGNIDAEYVGNLALTLGASADGRFGTVTVDAASASTLGNISISLAANASASVGNIAVQAADRDLIGTISVTGGATGTLTFGTIAASAAIGAITVGDYERVTIADIHASGVGSLTISGDAFTLTTMSAKTVGAIELAGSAGAITVDAGTVGAVTINGSGSQSFTLSSGGTTLGAISTVNNAGTAVVTVTNAAGSVSITGGTGTNQIYAATAVTTTINLAAGTGTDSIYIKGTGAGTVKVNNFDLLGSATDKIYLSSGGFAIGAASAAVAETGALNVVVATGGSPAWTFGSATVGTQVFVLGTGSYSTLQGALSGLGNMLSAVATGGAGASAIAANQDLLVLWYDSTNNATQLTLVNASAGPIQGTFTSTFANSNGNTLVTFSGVDITQMSGVSFTDKFNVY